jgi:hypothetical protein
MNILRAIYKYLSALFVVAILAQIGAAGYGAFYVSNKLGDEGDVLAHKGFEDGWNTHVGLGWTIAYASIILLILALIARVGRPRIWFALALTLAVVIQVMLAFLGESVPGLGFLHPLNALVVLSLAGLVAHLAWRKPAAT